LYADWDTLDGDETRLARLRLHVQEVAANVMATESAGTKVGAVTAEYFAFLRVERAALVARVERGALGGAVNRAAFH
jgi:hypothetical protein